MLRKYLKNRTYWRQCIKPNKGFRGFRALSSASSFVSVDNDSPRNPLPGLSYPVRLKKSG